MHCNISIQSHQYSNRVRRAAIIVAALALILLSAGSVAAVDLQPGDLLLTHGDIDFGQQLTLTRVNPVTAATDTITTFGAIPTEELEGVTVNSSGSILVLTGDQSAVTRVQPTTGVIDILSSSDLGVGAGPGLSEEPADITHLAGGHVAVLDLDFGRLLRVLPATGVRSVLSDGSGGPLGTEGPVGDGPDFDDPWAVAMGESNLFVADQSGAVFQVDSITGSRTIIADDATGRGPSLFGIDALAIMPDGSLLAADEDAPFSLLSIDASSGNRKIISDSLIGNGPLPGQVKDIAVDVLGIIYVIDTDNLYRIDPLNGTRKLISLPLGPPRRHLTNLAVVHQIPEPSAALLLALATPLALLCRLTGRRRHARYTPHSIARIRRMKQCSTPVSLHPPSDDR